MLDKITESWRYFVARLLSMIKPTPNIKAAVSEPADGAGIISTVMGQNSVNLLLLEHERKTSTWIKTEAYLNARLASLRAQNDAPLSETETATIRGRISEIKLLRSATDEKKYQFKVV